MNFQLQRRPKADRSEQRCEGGYLDAAGTPTEALLANSSSSDDSFASWVAELKAKGLYDSTLIVITAKHGQSSDRSQPVCRSDDQRHLARHPALQRGLHTNSESTNNPTGIGPTEDDVSLVWLKSSADTEASVKILEDNPSTSTGIGLGQIYYGPLLSRSTTTTRPRTRALRTSSFTPNVGVTYSSSKAKTRRTRRLLPTTTPMSFCLLSNPSFQPKTVSVGLAPHRWLPRSLRHLTSIQRRCMPSGRRDSVLPTVKLSW